MKSSQQLSLRPVQSVRDPCHRTNDSIALCMSLAFVYSVSRGVGVGSKKGSTLIFSELHYDYTIHFGHLKYIIALLNAQM